LLLVRREIVNAALEKTLAGGDLVQEQIDDQELIFLPSVRWDEEGIAARVKFLAAAPPNFPPIDLEKAVAWRRGYRRLGGAAQQLLDELFLREVLR
jgi:hypothetical protein